MSTAVAAFPQKGCAPPLPILEALDAEWNATLRAGQVCAALVRWGRTDPVLGSYTDFCDLDEASWAPDLDARDEMLLALIRRCQDPAESHRQLAARCVLQLLRPGLRQMVWELARRRVHTDADEIAAAAFGAAYETIVGFRATAGRRRVAASLLLDARKITVNRALLPTSAAWNQCAAADAPTQAAYLSATDLDETPPDQDMLLSDLAEALRARIIDADDPAVARRCLLPESLPDARDELLSLLVEAVRARALTVDDARLAVSGAQDGIGYQQLAADFGISEPTARKRRSRAVAKLSKFVGVGGHNRGAARA